MVNEERKLTCRQRNWNLSTTLSANVSTDKIARVSASANVQPSDSPLLIPVMPLMISTKLSLLSAFPPKTRWLAAPSSPFRWSIISPEHSSSSRTATDRSGTTQKLGDRHRWSSFLDRQLPLGRTRHTLSERGGHFILIARASHRGFDSRRVYRNITWRIFIFIHQKLLFFLFLSLIKLSAINHVSMQFQGHIPASPSPLRKMKRKLEMGMCFPKRGVVSQHVCEAFRQMNPRQRTFQDRVRKTETSTSTQTIHIHANEVIILLIIF